MQKCQLILVKKIKSWTGSGVLMVSMGVTLLISGTLVAEEAPAVPRSSGMSKSGPDSDSDGFKDAVDLCPSRPETWNRIKDDDGCPEYDTDGDGKFDADDRCPVGAETWNGYEDDDGCPELDLDHDGFIDNQDACPHQPEIWNRIADYDGCPDGEISANYATTVEAQSNSAKSVESSVEADSQITSPVLPTSTTSGATSSPPPAADNESADLLAEIEAAMAAAPSAEANAVILSPVTNAPRSFSNAFNPSTSMNGLFFASYISAPDETQETAAKGAPFRLGLKSVAAEEEQEEAATGLGIQEVELQFMANIDPYLGGNLILAIEGQEGIEIEEAVVNVTPTWHGLALRLGKMLMPFGRENPYHTHALPFIDRSLIGQTVLSEHGFNEFGAEISYLPPTPWYVLLSASVLNGDNEILFSSPTATDLAAFGAIKSVFELGGDATLEAGLSATVGQNAEQALAKALGGHLVLKWRPAANAGRRAATVVFEAIKASGAQVGAHDHAAEKVGLAAKIDPLSIAVEVIEDERVAGFYAYAQWQLVRRWHTAARFDYVALPDEVITRESVIGIYAPTEFSAIRLQASVTREPDLQTPILAAFAQLNFTLGAHPAHTY